MLGAAAPLLPAWEQPLFLEHLAGDAVGLLALALLRVLLLFLFGLLHGLFDLVGPVHQALQQQGVKRTALAVDDHVEGRFVVKGRLIAALTGQRIVHIGQGNDLGGDGDLIALEPVGIASAVPPLVVPAADLAGDLHQGFVLVEGDLAQHVLAHGGVGLDDLKLLFRQPAGFI